MNTNAATASTEADTGPRRLYPASIAFLIEERPLLWYEKPEDYDNLRGGVFDNLAPRDTLECIFSKNLADCFWEHRRMRGLMQTAINFAMPGAAGKLLAPGITSFDVDRRRKAERQAESVAHGVEEDISGDDPSLQQQMEKALVTHEEIHLKAYESQMERVAHIRHECERIENRIHWLLKNFETRRATMAAMARSLVENELAQTGEYREASSAMAEPRRTPSALRHGLFSRHARLEWSPQVQGLGDALLGASPRQPQVIEAAREAAEAILWLRQIQQWRLAILEHAALSYANRTEAERDPALRLSDMVKGAAASDCAPLRDEVCAAHDRAWLVDLAPASDYFLHLKVADHATELRRLADYERRAHSRRRKALRRLDYERVEAERRRVAAEATARHSEAEPGFA